LELSVPDVQQIIKIALDEEPKETLAFVKEKLFKRVKSSLQRSEYWCLRSVTAPKSEYDFNKKLITEKQENY
jgi:hypothetical protein